MNTAPAGAGREQLQRRLQIKQRTAEIVAVFGAILPALMVTLRLSQSVSFQSELLLRFGEMLMHAVLGCSVGAMLLTFGLFNWLVHRPHFEQTRLIASGALGGTLIAFLNLPGYGAFFYLSHDDSPWLRLMLLFTVAGSTCGMWIGWQVWRALHPEERLLPRFTLKTLLLLVFMWGSLLLAFQPDRSGWTRDPRHEFILDKGARPPRKK